jgi:hypothetical protein
MTVPESHSAGLEPTRPSGSASPASEAVTLSPTAIPGHDETDVAPLLSARVAATAAAEDTTPERWRAFLLALVAEDDLAGAYWLSRSLTSRGMTPEWPAWLLAAAQGARWLDCESDAFVSDLVDVTATGHPEGQSQGLVALSAALHALVLAPTSGLGLWRSWLNLPGVGSALGEINEAVAEFGT